MLTWTPRTIQNERNGPAMNSSKMLSVLALCVVALIVVPGSRAGAADKILFDDFSYGNNETMKRNGWILRTEPGWPGVPGATWSEDGVSLHKDPGQPATGSFA